MKISNLPLATNPTSTDVLPLDRNGITYKMQYQALQGPQGPQGAPGPKGDTGKGISSYTEYYAVNNSTTPPADSAFGTTYVSPTATNRYLWSYTVIQFSDNTDLTSDKRLLCVYGQTGNTGATGNGIASIAKTGTSGLVDTYTVTMTNGSTSTFTVTNGEKGDTGDKGDTGETGPGVAAGGTAGQVLYKKSATDYDTEWAEPEVTAEQFAALEEYVRDMSPLETVGPAGSVSVADAAPLNAEQIAVDIEPVQAGSGDPSPTNVRPITGWTGAKVTRRGKNLLTSDTSDYVRGGEYLFLKDVVPDGQLARFTFTDKDTSVDISSCSIGFVYNNMSAGESAVDYRWVISKGAINNRVDNESQTHAGVLCGNVFVYPNTVETVQKLYARYNIMVELGDTATAYEPYVGDTHDIAFPSSAGTVYGGTLTINADGGGELVVNKFGHVFDGTENIISPVRSDLAMISFPGMAFKNWIYASAKRSSSHFGEPSTFGWDGVGANRWLAAGGNYWGFGGYTTSEFKSYAAAQYANGTPITCYTSLSTPITYALTAEQIMMLRGVNNVWADCGDTTLAYRADIPAYIDQRINATRSMIAGIEADMKATKAYSAGDLLIVGDTLYKATTSIASGATFTPGTNVTATTVAEQLILLANA